MTMINKQELLEWLYEERCNAQRQLDVLDPGDSNWYEYRGRTAAFNYVIYYVNSMPDAEPLQVEPKFKVGDRVKAVSGQYTGKSGILTHFNKDDPDFCRVRYDDHESEADELTDWIELIEDEPTRPNFKVGDRVKILFGIHKGCIGTIIDKVDDEPANMIQFDEGRKTWGNTATIELIKDEPAPSAKDIKVTFKLTGAEAFVESAKQLIEALEALEVEIDDERNKNTN